jgi:hypothetical protein
MTVSQVPTMPSASSVNLGEESVAGEENPGAAIDAPREGPRAAKNARSPSSPCAEAPPGPTGAGESICRECGRTGRLAEATCAACGGSGKVIVGRGRG